MKIFVTGATGFVGQNFLKLALDRSFEVTALVRPESRRELIQHPNLTWVRQSMDSDIRSYLKGHEALIHIAALTVNPPYASNSQCVYWNVYAPVKLFELAIEVGLKRFINIGSCFEYADSRNFDRPYSAKDELGPCSSYATSKAAATIALEGLAREKQVELTTLRLFQVYGDGEAENRLYPSLLEAAKLNQDFPMTEGNQLRDFISVDVVASKILLALDENYRPVAGEPTVYHLATGKSSTVLNFVRRTWQELGAKGRILPGEIASRNDQYMSIYSDKESLL